MGGSGDREAREFTGDGVLNREKEVSLFITYDAAMSDSMYPNVNHGKSSESRIM